MENFFSVSRTAKMVDMTAETLRHYDRIGLVKPSKVDEWTGYRYYSHGEIVKLNTVRALKVMDLKLDEIKSILQFDDFSKIIQALGQAEINADKKIAELNLAKQKIRNARLFYEGKLGGQTDASEVEIKELPQRTILLAKDLHRPTLDNLWDYHRHFYGQLDEKDKKLFSFEDLAGIYESGEGSHLFAVCTRYAQAENLLTLPKGKYLCRDCTEENKKEVTDKLLEIAQRQYNKRPQFVVHIVVSTGILQWNYQTQVYIN